MSFVKNTVVYTQFKAVSVDYDVPCNPIQSARKREMITKTRTALLVGAGELWNHDLYPILREMLFDIVSLESISDVRDALQSENYELVIVCRPFESMTLVSSLDVAKSLAPESRVLGLTDDMTERDLREALISGSFVAVNRPLGYRDMSALLSSAEQGLLVHVRN